MNSIIVSRSELIEALQKVSGPTTGKISFPVFSSVFIECFQDKIKFTTTDLELTMTTQIETKEADEKKTVFCVSLQKLLSILKEFSQGEVELKPQKNFLWITCGKCDLKLNIIDPKEFPKPPSIKDREAVKLSSSMLKDMIRYTCFSVFSGEGNYVLNGILCSIEKNKIELASTDGKRLSVVNQEIPFKQPEINDKKSFIIPQKSILELNKLLRDSEEEVILIMGDNRVGFDLKKVQMISQLIEGDFPEYRKYIPAKSENKLSVDREEFLSALKRASILTSPEYQGVKLELSSGKLVLLKNTPQLGEYKEDLSVDYKGKNISLGFNPAYLMDVLKVLEDDNVSFDVYDSEKPVVLRKPNYTYLALPMRLS